MKLNVNIRRVTTQKHFKYTLNGKIWLELQWNLSIERTYPKIPTTKGSNGLKSKKTLRRIHYRKLHYNNKNTLTAIWQRQIRFVTFETGFTGDFLANSTKSATVYFGIDLVSRSDNPLSAPIRTNGIDMIDIFRPSQLVECLTKRFNLKFQETGFQQIPEFSYLFTSHFVVKSDFH